MFAKIYQPSPSAMTSGRAKSNHWVLEFVTKGKSPIIFRIALLKRRRLNVLDAPMLKTLVSIESYRGRIKARLNTLGVHSSTG